MSFRGTIFVIVLIFGLFIIYFISFLPAEKLPKFTPTYNNAKLSYKLTNYDTKEYNVWLIFTKVELNSSLKYKFHNLIWNLLNVSAIPLKFHVIVDDLSKKIAAEEFFHIVNVTKEHVPYFFYNVKDAASKMQDIVSILTPHFSSKPGTYYSDALFYVSLGLYRIAPVRQKVAVLLDCDLYFKEDIKLLFKEFEHFKDSALFGLAPELTPVYRHILHTYRSKHRNSTFGEYYHQKNYSNNSHPRGFQGYNSGVVLLNLTKIRNSNMYQKVLSNKTVNALVSKYKFKGHLGDQDFYTLLGIEYPDLVQTINCGFNRQLCTWWRDHGYVDVFDKYFKCDHKTIVLHGNCNTKILK